VRASVEARLRSLGIETIDLYHQHRAAPKTSIEKNENKQYNQLLTWFKRPPRYSKIRVKRTNHGWGITGGDSQRRDIGNPRLL
jgi:hypothetical protein